MARLLSVIGAVFVLLIVIAGVWYVVQPRTPQRMTLAQVVALAQMPQSACSMKGTVAATGTYNENSDTWWLEFTASPQYAQSGCNPACVVSATGTVEINWRCTGLIVPDTFDKTGVVTRDNPGQTPGVWYLVYDEPGAPGKSVELDLNAVAAPYIDLTNGMRVHVAGQLQGNTVLVRTIVPADQTETGTHVSLYYYNPARDQGTGGVQCSAKGLVAVDRVIPTTTTPLADAIRLLLRGEITAQERAQGVTTEFPLRGLALTNAVIENGTATLTFADPQSASGGGSCRVAVLRAQIAATAKQFPSVTSVRFKPDTLFQP